MNDSAKQFVIQQHTTPDGVHWDLMLEMDDCLWTWRLRVPPADIGNAPIPAERIADHPLRFLTYEGPVQHNTGNVKIADKGTVTQHVIPTEAACHGIAQRRRKEPVKKIPRSDSLYLNQATLESLTFKLQGTILKGTFTFSKTPNALIWILKQTH